MTVSPAWTVVQVSGEVRVRAAVQDQPETPWQTLETGTLIAEASEIETGPNGLARLTRGEDIIRIMPASRLAVPPRPANSIFTRIRVLFGKAFFDVDKRPGQEFEVQTPYLAAIVKGTSFSVSVTSERSRVNVAEGRVGVTALNGQSVTIGPGESARVTSQPGSGVSTEPLAPGEFDDPAPASDDGGPDGNGEQRGESRDNQDDRDQAKADNPGKGRADAPGKGRGNAKRQGTGKPVVISKSLGSIKLDSSSAT
ncbi:MAG: FecR domain-containing protein, partial [Rhodospirillaceae bacterium]|nr:FecR domain-containing protein [Rhodospirillaceae bacterium]